MTLRLILIRHAKSSWDDFSQEDHGRVLNERGKKAAPLVGQWLSKNNYVPELVLCSDALRTRETLDLILPSWSREIEVVYENRLYLAPASDMLSALRSANKGTVAIIGHNPGIGSLASRLVKKSPEHPKFGQYPTCATTIIDFEAARWMDIQVESGTVVDFIVPRDLRNE